MEGKEGECGKRKTGREREGESEGGIVFPIITTNRRLCKTELTISEGEG